MSQSYILYNSKSDDGSDAYVIYAESVKEAKQIVTENGFTCKSGEYFKDETKYYLEEPKDDFDQDDLTGRALSFAQNTGKCMENDGNYRWFIDKNEIGSYYVWTTSEKYYFDTTDLAKIGSPHPDYSDTEEFAEECFIRGREATMSGFISFKLADISRLQILRHTGAATKPAAKNNNLDTKRCSILLSIVKTYVDIDKMITRNR